MGSSGVGETAQSTPPPRQGLRAACAAGRSQQVPGAPVTGNCSFRLDSHPPLRLLAQLNPSPTLPVLVSIRERERAEPLALILFEAMKSHLQYINAMLSWPGLDCLLEERSLESNLLGRWLPEHLLTKSNYALRGRLK